MEETKNTKLEQVYDVLSGTFNEIAGCQEEIFKQFCSINLPDGIVPKITATEKKKCGTTFTYSLPNGAEVITSCQVIAPIKKAVRA